MRTPEARGRFIWLAKEAKGIRFLVFANSSNPDQLADLDFIMQLFQVSRRYGDACTGLVDCSVDSNRTSFEKFLDVARGNNPYISAELRYFLRVLLNDDRRFSVANDVIGFKNILLRFLSSGAVDTIRKYVPERGRKYLGFRMSLDNSFVNQIPLCESVIGLA